VKVLHLINNLNREGAQIVIFNLVSSNTQEDIQHLVCARQPGGQLQDALKQKGIKVFVPECYYGILKTGHSIKFIKQIIKNEAIDLIHAHMADAAFLGWIVARKCSLPLVISHHGHDLLPKCSKLCRVVYKLLVTVAAHYAKINIAVSHSVAERAQHQFFLNNDRVTVITNGVPVPSGDHITKQNKSDKRELRIVTVGRLIELKGQSQLINAAAQLVKKYQNILFFLIGDGPLKKELQLRADELDIADHIVFTGSIADVPVYLNTADIYVSTSCSEGMPMATLEAMAWNVPVVASDIPGNRTVVEDGKTGLLYQAGNAAALAEIVDSIIENPIMTRERARQARQMVEEKYSADVTSKAHNKMYEKILSIC